MLADLAVAPVPISACINGVVELTEADGLPPLIDYALGMVLAEQLSPSAQAAADQLRASFASKTKAA